MTTTLNSRSAADRTRDAARTIESLSSTNITEDKFFQQFVETLAEALEAEAGGVWLLGGTGLLALMSETGLAHVGLTQNPAAHPGHLELMLDAVRTGQAAIHAPGQSRRLPSRHVLLQAPVRYQDRPIGVVELFLPEDAPEGRRLDQLQFLEEMCVCASRYLAWRAEAGSPTNHLEFWNRFERLIARLHASLDGREVAATAANDGRQLLSCDRVSVAVRRGPKTDVLAISGQDHVNRRSNLVRLLSTLAAAAIRAGQPVVYTGKPDGVPPPLLPVLTEYVKESGSRMVKVIPLFAPEPDIEDEGAAVRRSPRRAFGAMVIEQVAESWLTPLIAERTDLLAQHVAGSLHNARQHERIFLLPLWRGLGRGAALLRGRTLLKLVLAAGALAGIGTALAVVPAEYRVEGTGRLMPAVQRDVFAPWDGDVDELFVESGQQVAAGQPLLRLRNDELNTEILTARSKLDEKRQQLAALKVEIDEAARNSQREDGIRLRGKHAQTQIEIEGLEKRIAALEEQQATLTVRAPIDGTVATFQLEQRLLHRPVTRGEVLLELMDESGPWRLEVEVPESRMGHVLAAQRAAASPRLPVEFVLATHPDHTFRGTLDETATRAGASPEHGTTVDAHVSLDPATLPTRRIGAEVEAKIHCGERSLFYVLFGDVVEFAQRQWW